MKTHPRTMLVLFVVCAIVACGMRGTGEASGIIYADKLPGNGDACAKIVKAISLLPTEGGIIDARGFTGLQQCATNPFAGIGKTLLLTLGGLRIQTKTPWLITDNSHIKILGSGPALSVLEYAGARGAPYVLGIVNSNPRKHDVTGVTIEGLSIIGGNTNVSDGLYLQGIHRSQFRDLSFWGVTGAAIRTRFAVTDTFANCHASPAEMKNYGLFVGRSAPAQLFRFSSYSTEFPSQTTNGTVIDAIAEGLTGVGWWLESASSMTFTSGTSEDNLEGLLIDQLSANNTFIGSDFEANRGGWDVTDNGTSSQFINVIAVSSNPSIILGPSSKFAVVNGGNVAGGVRPSPSSQSPSAINGPTIRHR